MNITGKRIIVTGSRGFIGSHLAYQLKQEGVEVIELDINDGVDITNWQRIKDYNDIDIIYHLAAKTRIPAKDLNGNYFANITGTLNMLELGRINNVQKFIFASSYVYGQPQYLPIDEAHPINPTNPYNRSKVIGEELCYAYHKDYGLKCVIVRAFNVYGKGQKGDFLIPTILKQISGGTIQLNDYEPRRDFLYIDDIVKAYIKAMAYSGADYSMFNIGSGKSYSVAEIVDKIMTITSKTPIVQYLQKRRPDEIMDIIANISKAKQELDWQPNIDIDEGLRKCLPFLDQ